MKPDPTPITTREAATLLGLSPRTLEKHRYHADWSLPYHHYPQSNRVYYLKHEVLQWLTQNRKGS